MSYKRLRNMTYCFSVYICLKRVIVKKIPEPRIDVACSSTVNLYAKGGIIQSAGCQSDTWYFEGLLTSMNLCVVSYTLELRIMLLKNTILLEIHQDFKGKVLTNQLVVPWYCLLFLFAFSMLLSISLLYLLFLANSMCVSSYKERSPNYKIF